MRNSDGTPLHCDITGKVMYSQKEAFVQLKKMRKMPRKNKNKHVKRAYMCEFCGKWHLTSEKKGLTLF